MKMNSLKLRRLKKLYHDNTLSFRSQLNKKYIRAVGESG